MINSDLSNFLEKRTWPLLLAIVFSFSVSYRIFPGMAAEFEVEVSTIRPLSVDNQQKKAIGYSLVELEKTGIRFVQSLSDELRQKNRILLIGAGIAIFDFDQDGKNDLLFLLAEGENELYRNLGGFRFEKVANAAGMALPSNHSAGVSIADVNHDGRPDVIISTLDAGPKLFISESTGRFRLDDNAGFLDIGGATSGLFGDIDNDGDLDFFQSMYREDSIKDHRYLVSNVKADQQGNWIIPDSLKNRLVSTRNLNGQPMLLEKGRPDLLYLNNGKGQFSIVDSDEIFHPIVNRNGGSPLDGWTLSASFHDFNNDGFLDLYTCADFLSPDRFWKNMGGGKFAELSWPFVPKTSYSSMDVAWGDLNNDGLEDFFVVDMQGRKRRDRMKQRANMGPNVWMTWAEGYNNQVMRNTLFRNRGDGSFAEIALQSNVSASDWSWSTQFHDVDLDGLLDIIVANGTPHDVQDSDAIDQLFFENAQNSFSFVPADLPPQQVKNIIWKNSGNFQFEELSQEWGFSSESYSQSMAFGDLDGDGDKDIVINNFDGAPQIYRCDTTSSRVVVNFKSNDIPGLVDRLALEMKSESLSQYRVPRTSHGYLSHSTCDLVFACPDEIGELIINGPGDKEPLLTLGVKQNSLVEISLKATQTENSSQSKKEVGSSPAIVRHYKSFIPEKSPKWKTEHSDYMESSPPVYHHWDSRSFQMPDFGQAIQLSGLTKYIQPEPNNGFAIYALNKDISENYVWKSTRLESNRDWPSRPSGMTSVSGDGKLNPISHSIVVHGTEKSSNGSDNTWLYFFKLDNDNQLQLRQSFKWNDQIVGKVKFSENGNYLFVGAQMNHASDSSQGGGIIFFKDDSKSWNYLKSASTLIPAQLPIVGCEWVIGDDKVAYLLLAQHRGTVEILRIDSTETSPRVVRSVGLGDEHSGLWIHSNLFHQNGKMILLLGNIGANSIYNEYDHLEWITAQTDAGFILSLPAEQRGADSFLSIDRESLSRFLPQIPRLYPTRSSYAQATLQEITNAIPLFKVYHTDSISTLEHRVFEVVSEGSQLQFKELILDPKLQEAPLMTSAMLSADKIHPFRILVGQNFSSMKYDQEPLDSGGGGLLEIGTDSGVSFSYMGEKGLRMYSDIKKIIPGKWLGEQNPAPSETILVFRDGLDPVLFLSNESVPLD